MGIECLAYGKEILRRGLQWFFQQPVLSVVIVLFSIILKGGIYLPALVATPGRILNHLVQENYLSVSRIRKRKLMRTIG